MATYGTLTADGDTDIITARGPTLLVASGTWGGGTLVAKYKSADGTWRDLVSETPITSDSTGQVLFDLPGAEVTLVKATLSGATTPSLFWEFRR